jgi:hypothetical protein
MKVSMHKKIVFNIVILFIVVFSQPLFSQTTNKENWTHFARLSGTGINSNNIDKIMEKAQEQGALGIELDNDITGRYESFLDPTQKLIQIKKAAEAAHKIGNNAFIYIAALECITGNSDKTDHTMFKEHPDWVQRDITGKPAVFGGGAAFWITKGDEDVYISPYAKEWRKIYMERVRQIAATGIDGVYIDVAYWMWLYEGWSDSWTSFDDYTVAAFKERTGVDAKKDFIPGDFNNPNFLKWIDFRIQTITEFFKEIDENIKSVNPNCLTIPEISPSVNDEVVRSGADVYELHKYSEVIAHEFFINTNTGAKRNTFDWLTYVLGVNTLRAFDEDKATWLLSYSWDGEENANAIDAMKLLSCAQVMAGANFWDAPGHSMAGSNDYPTRVKIFSWIKENEELLYSPRKSINPIGVYFSPTTRNYFADDYIKSYYGTLHLLLNNHLEYQIVTPRTLNSFSGSKLILPDVKILNEEETDILKRFYDNGINLIVTGETGDYDSLRTKKKENIIHKFLTTNNNSGVKYLYLPECPGKKYYNTHDVQLITSFNEQINNFLLNYKPKYKIKASFNVSVRQADLNDKDCIFITNLKGLKGYSTCVPETEEKIVIEFESSKTHDIYFIPYLGKKQKINVDYKHDTMGKGQNIISFTLPPIQFGGIIIIEK